jgi:hypothetical protein
MAGDSLSEFGPTLKEWATITRSLEKGKTAVLFRKGGIREKGFGVPSCRFFLLPTYVHQEKEKFSPEFHKIYQQTCKEDPGPEKLVIRSLAEVVQSARTSDAAKLKELSELTPLTSEELEKRYKWKADQALHVLIIRTFMLKNPIEVPIQEDFKGCKSWIELGPQGEIELSEPALGESQLKDVRLRIQEILTP